MIYNKKKKEKILSFYRINKRLDTLHRAIKCLKKNTHYESPAELKIHYQTIVTFLLMLQVEIKKHFNQKKFKNYYGYALKPEVYGTYNYIVQRIEIINLEYKSFQLYCKQLMEHIARTTIDENTTFEGLKKEFNIIFYSLVDL